MAQQEDSLLDVFTSLVRVPSPSRHEREAAKVVAARIRELGFEALEDDSGKRIGGDCGNLVVKVPGTGKGPKLLLGAHIDTVEKQGEKPAAPIVDGDWIRREGGGILGADDKTGVAVLLEVMAALKKEKRKHGDLLFVFTVCEETEALGASHLDPELYRGYDAGVILDHSLPNEIVIAAPTKVAFRMTFHGIAGHAAFPERKINAAHVMAKTLARLPMGRLDSHTTANLGIAHSGTAINVIPGTGYAEYEIRSHRKDVLDYHVKRVVGIVEATVRECRVFAFGDDEIKDAVKYASVDVEVEVGYEGYRHEEGSKVVALLSRAVKQAGMEPKLIVAQGGSDANIFNPRGLASAVVGCGMHGAHSADERANLAEMRGAVEVVKQAILGG